MTEEELTKKADLLKELQLLRDRAKRFLANEYGPRVTLVENRLTIAFMRGNIGNIELDKQDTVLIQMLVKAIVTTYLEQKEKEIKELLK